jgi:L-lactate dehydrogenase
LKDLENNYPNLMEDMGKIAVDVKNSAYEIIKAKRATYYGIGMTLARLTRAVLFDENSVFTVSAYLKGEYEHNGIYIGVPCIINRKGVREILKINLSNEEKEKLNISANIIEEMKKEIGI